MPPTTSSPTSRHRPQVGLFVTCLADLFRPSVAFDTLTLLERCGCDVTVPEAQTCCGQPGYNSGDYEAPVALAKQVIEQFEAFDYLVAPSGSCAGMIREHYPRLLDGKWQERAKALAEKTYELTSFLKDIAGLRRGSAEAVPLPSLTYHDSCAGLREMGVKEQPRALIADLCDREVTELERTEVCCGFGGTFCAKMPEISGKMTDDKLDSAAATGAELVVGGDLGCLMSLAGRARRRGLDLEFRHVAEVLAGDLDGPGIGRGERS